jgi:hypothetical protein
MPGRLLFVFLLLSQALAARCVSAAAAGDSNQFIEMSLETIEDKIRGGLLGQLLGNLNGLPHENKYYDQPGNVENYVPALPDGARTDDDTDIEWVYIVAIQRSPTVLLPPPQITQLWKTHINEHIWCSNLYVRRLMDIGIDPPLTGSPILNPWADFNISGQFVCETFALLAPAMPRTAARIALHYTHVSIDGEPAQATQLFASMIAAAFTTNNIDKILNAGAASIDPDCLIRRIVADVRSWHKQCPDDWRTARRLIKDKYTLYENRTRNQNGCELCTAAAVAALLYGQGDFVKTLTHAFNFGWDADNNAATAGTIVGVINGRRWMQQKDWQIKDVYRNTTRPGMPEDETITGFADRIIEIAGRVIIENGGEKSFRDGKIIYRIRSQEPANIEPLPDPNAQTAILRSKLGPQIFSGLAPDASTQQQARAAYLAICLGLADSLKKDYAERWPEFLAALQQYPQLLDVLFSGSVGPAGDRLHNAAAAAGLKKPKQ